VLYDMCTNSCCLFAGRRTDLDHCDFFPEPQYHADGMPRCRFSYLPFTGHVKAWFESVEMIHCMDYQHSYKHVHRETSDIFDGDHYHTLLTQYVSINSKQLPHKFFSDLQDVTLRISMYSCQAWVFFFLHSLEVMLIFDITIDNTQFSN